MELRVLCFKEYIRMDYNKLDEMAQQQYLLGLKNYIIREQLII